MSFQQGLSGLNAASKHLEVIGNNVANSNTVGYKGARAQFGDVFANTLGGGSQVGIGTQVSAVSAVFSQGNINTSPSPLDIAINGQGFFRISNDGSTTFTRNGQFSLDREGYIVASGGGRLTGYPANAAGTVSTATPADLRISTADIAPTQTAEARVLANFDSRAAALPPAGFNLNDSSTFSSATSLSVYDSLGNPHTLSLYFLKSAPNAWQIFGAVDGNQIGVGALGALNFGSDGAINTGTTTLPVNVGISLTNGAASPMTVAVDFTGSTQFGASFAVTELTQNGFASGRLSGFSIGGDGTILGRYSNGQSRAQGQIVLVNFTNPGGLQALGGNGWAETSASGQPIVGVPGAGNLGVLQSGALEESNIDLTAELVTMITAQRGYQANAQTIKTQDSVMQTLVNLR